MSDYVVLVLGGIRVGIFGLTLSDHAAPAGLRLRSRHVARRRARARRPREQEFVVGLTHQEIGDDEWLANEFPTHRLIVGGHEHVAQFRKVGDDDRKADADPSAYH
jgi:2',3'-cyclic-nucleotide 2'-phosphodiesterase (5'-nucleotidase family)